MNLGSQVNEFGSAMERIRNKQVLLKENAVKLSVMKGLKEIQSALTTISFLDVLASIDINNPVVSKVQEFEIQLSELRKGIEEFVVSNHFDSAEDASLNPEIPETQSEDDKKAEDEEKQQQEELENQKISASGVKDDKKDVKSDDKEAKTKSEKEEEDEKEENKKKLEKSSKK